MAASDVARLENRVDVLTTHADAHDESQRAISDTLVDLMDRFDVLSGNVDTLSGTVGELQRTVDQHTTTLDRHSAILDQHTGMLVEILRLVGGSAPTP